MKSSSLSHCTPVALPTEAASTPASWLGLLSNSVRAALLVMVVSGIAYPLLTTGVAQALFPHAANGSLIEHQGQVVGSELIGQQFSGPQYFHGRPSATMAAPYNAGLSGASNQGATHKDLSETIVQRVAQYRAENGLPADALVPVDAVTASASGLDPHISQANALLQLPRVVQARGFSPDQVQLLLAQNTAPRTLGLLGEPRVNVLQLNLALDALQPVAKFVKE